MNPQAVGRPPAPADGERAARPLIALLGGTFDPPHQGHLHLALRFALLLPLTQLWLIPAGQPWQKDAGITPTVHRLRMTEIAADALRESLARVLAGREPPRVRVSRIEIDHEGPNYTTETLVRLRAELGADVALAWLMGADQLQRLDTWRNWRALFGQTHLCVATRPGYRLDTLPDAVRREVEARLAAPALLQSRPSGCVVLDRELAIELSSTALRQSLAQPRPAPVDLPAGVAEYIAEHHLYR